MDTGQEITIKEFFGKMAEAGRYLGRKWKWILCFSLACAMLGLGYSFLKKTKYTAVCTFVLEDDSKLGMLSQYSGLASLAGIDLNNGGGGLFQGDNILELYKSRTMIEKALLSTADFDGKSQQLIERYIGFNQLREKWRKKDNISAINFAGDPADFNRKQDSIITDLVKDFNKKMLVVNRLDKKLNIIVVQFTNTDEKFSQVFTDRLVDMVNRFYIQTKTKKSADNLAVLQRQADSVKAVINASIGGVASALDATPNANPNMLSLKVPGQRRQIDVQASSAVYGEIVKNLEIAKITLRQDLPLIQIIDSPVLPLENDRVSSIKGLLLGLFIGAFIIVSVLFIKKLLF